MSTRTQERHAERVRREQVNERLRQVRARQRRRRIARAAAVWGVGLVLAGVVAGALMLTARPESAATTRPAPGFTLSDTTGRSVSLADLHGRNVLLYFNEGAGCQSCLVQMAEIEKHTGTLDELDLVVLPIVMNTREQILADMAANGVRTPFLLDDGAVSAAYGALGIGMHAGLPGHSFALIDADGTQRWFGAYPSMWLPPEQLFDLVRQHLPD